MSTQGPTVTLRMLADALADALEEANPDSEALLAYRRNTLNRWVKQAELSRLLNISPRTLVRWRNTGYLEEGTEWRRLSMSNGHTVYSVNAVRLKMGEREIPEDDPEI